MKTFLTILLYFFIYSANAQPGIAWQKSLGGNYDDRAFAIEQTTDGGYIVAGRSNSTDGNVTGHHANGDYWIVKLDATGYLAWQKCLGGYDVEEASSIHQTSDGGYILAGYSFSSDGDVTKNYGNGDYWVVKIDSVGNISWQKSLGGSLDDHATSIQQTFDGGYIVAGYSNSNDSLVSGNHGSSDYWIVKLNPSGNVSWQKCLGGSGADEANSILQDSDGGFVVAGYSASDDGDVLGNNGSADYWIVKLDSIGNLLWQNNLGGSGNEGAYSVHITSDGGYIVAGFTTSNDSDVTGNHGNEDYWIAKLNANGNLAWQKCLGGSAYDDGYSIQQTTDGGYVIAGSSWSNDLQVSGNHGNEDYWIAKIDTSGNLDWQKSIGGIMGDVAYAIEQTTDDGFIIAGYSLSNEGDVSGNHGYYDFWIVKLNAPTGMQETNKEEIISIYPNPTEGNVFIHIKDQISVSMSISTLLGQEVFQSSIDEKVSRVDMNSFGKKGIFVLTFRNAEGNIMATKKIVVN